MLIVALFAVAKVGDNLMCVAGELIKRIIHECIHSYSGRLHSNNKNNKMDSADTGDLTNEPQKHRE